MNKPLALYQKISSGLICLLIFTPLMVSAMTTVTVTVTVIMPPPCTINGDRVIDVNFGSDVVTNRVNGANYLQVVDYTLECNGNTSNAMKLRIQGTPTAFDSGALQTNISDFGIALRANSQPLKINNWVNFTYPNKPLLEAVPVKRAGATLAGGDFSAGATLLVHYQ